LYIDISPFTFTQKTGSIFRPTAHPVCKFATPILQIAAPAATHEQTSGAVLKFHYYGIIDLTYPGLLLAVRTYGSLVFHQINAVSAGSRLDLNEVARFSRSDFHDRHSVDVIMMHTHPCALVINDCGMVYRASLHGHGGPPILLVIVLHPVLVLYAI
jgi:hypothetical protein